MWSSLGGKLFCLARVWKNSSTIPSDGFVYIPVMWKGWASLSDDIFHDTAWWGDAEELLMTLVCSTCSPAASRVRIATPPLYSCCRLCHFYTPATCWILHPLSTISTGRKVDDRWCSVMMMMSRFLKQDKLPRYVHFALECPSMLIVKILINLLGG